MRAEAAVAAILVAVLVVLPVGAVGVASVAAPSAVGGDARVAPPAVDGGPAATSPTPAPPTRTVTIDVQLRRSGDARWTVSTYVPLADDNETEAFREFGEDFERGTADVRFEADLFRQYASAASEASDRSMAVPEDTVRRRAAVVNGTGVLTLEFTWTNFARTDGDRLVVNDSFRTETGTWLPRLREGQALVIRPPEGYGIIEAPPAEVSEATFRWEGPAEFGDDYFYIVYSANGRRSPLPPSSPPSTSPPGSSTPQPPGFDLAGLFLAAALLFGGSLVVYLTARRRSPDDSPPAGAASTNGDEPAGGVPPATTGNGTGPSGDVSGDADPTPEDPFAGVDVELLSDEERVLLLLEANGGRMKQARIVRETDWSNAKVSQLLSSMADEEKVDKLRIGRENLISLPDVDVENVER